MLVLISYDVATENKDGRSRLRKIAKLCEDYGVRVQHSVFECIVNPAQWIKFREKLLDLYNTEKDSLRFYYLGSNPKNKIEHHGIKEKPNLEDDFLSI